MANATTVPIYPLFLWGRGGVKMVAKKVLDDGGDVLRTLSRYMQLIGVPIALALMFWQASTIWTLSLSMAKIETKVDALDGDRYSKSDAMKDQALLQSNIDSLDKAMAARWDATDKRVTELMARMIQIEHKP